MRSNSVKLRRRPMRLKDYDYSSPGAYFITITTADRACLFGAIAHGEVRLNVAGCIVQRVWNELPAHYPDVETDEFVIMPNHFHGVVVLLDPITVGAGLKPAPSRHGIPEIVRAFKTFSARPINEMRRAPGVSIWQRNYFETVIRNEQSLNRIRQYILDNPARWEFDRENPEATNPERNEP